jgi:hypothetical protein
MHLDTDQLLSLARGRGNDTDADRAHVAACAACAAELERLQGVRAELQALPLLAPPPGGWQRIVAAADAAAPRPARRPYALAAAAAVAALAVAVVLQLPAGDGTRVTGMDRSTAVATAAAPPSGPAAGWQLVESENARLEALLAALPSDGRVRASTGYTVSTLEDRLALVDDRLSQAAFEPLAPGQAEQLWRERLYLMNSLVKVRYAQAAAGL